MAKNCTSGDRWRYLQCIALRPFTTKGTFLTFISFSNTFSTLYANLIMRGFIYTFWFSLFFCQFYAIGQLISKCLFDVFNFFQKTNENKSTSSKVEFVPSFFGRNVDLKKSFQICLNFRTTHLVESMLWNPT